MTDSVRDRAPRVAEDVAAAGAAAVEKSGNLVNRGAAELAKGVSSIGESLAALAPLTSSTGGLAVGHDSLSNFVANLNWANVDPAKYLYTSTRGISRGMEEAYRV